MMGTGSLAGAVLVGWLCVVNTVVVRTQDTAPEPSKNDLANMDRGQEPAVYGCGDSVPNTVSGRVVSSINPGEPALNCSLTLTSPPGTSLSLSVLSLTLVPLVHADGSSCSGNRLRILAGDDPLGAPSLLPSFPHGLCGSAVPNQPVVSPGNRVTLLLETTQLAVTVKQSFEIMYTAFKTTPDGECFECEVDSSREWPFCIHPSLVCDGVQNCLRFTEETGQNCENSTNPPSSDTGTTALLIAGILIAVAIVFIFIFLLSLALAKRVYSKRAGERARHRREMPMHQLSQRQRSPRSADPTLGGPADYQRAGPAEETGAFGAPYGMPVGPMAMPPPDAPVCAVVAGSPPPYSTLPRQSEHCLQMGEDTNPTSRSRSGSVENNLDSAAPQTPQ